MRLSKFEMRPHTPVWDKMWSRFWADHEDIRMTVRDMDGNEKDVSKWGYIGSSDRYHHFELRGDPTDYRIAK